MPVSSVLKSPMHLGIARAQVHSFQQLDCTALKKRIASYMQEINLMTGNQPAQIITFISPGAAATAAAI